MAHFTGCSISDDENPANFLKVQVGEQSWQVEIADDDRSRHRGLMFREILEDNKGMLFVFDESRRHSFWMKNTLIPLDIIWISEDKKVTDIQTLQPCKTEICESYQPETNAKYVLEVGAGKFRGNLGDDVNF